MTRIIAGYAKGQKLLTPDHGTRPTTDRVREAIFNTLTTLGALPDARVLDLYAGSGALALEALSRGAANAVFIEKSRKATDIIRQNCIKTCAAAGAQYTIVCSDVQSYLTGIGKETFDLIFCDPPYQLSSAAVTEILRCGIPLLSEDPILVIERSARSSPVLLPAGLQLYQQKTYGETAIMYLERA